MEGYVHKREENRLAGWHTGRQTAADEQTNSPFERQMDRQTKQKKIEFELERQDESSKETAQGIIRETSCWGHCGSKSKGAVFNKSHETWNMTMRRLIYVAGLSQALRKRSKKNFILGLL